MSETKKAKATEGAQNLILIAGMDRRARRAHLGIEVLNADMLGSADVLLCVLKRYPKCARSLLNDLDINEDALRSRLVTIEITSEPEPELKSEQSLEVKKAMGGRVPFSAVVRSAMQNARTSATEEGRESYGPGDVLAEMLLIDCDARAAILELAGVIRLGVAIENLRQAPLEEGDYMDARVASRTELIQASWTRIRDESSKRTPSFQEKMDEIYDRDPNAYEKPLNLAAKLSAVQANSQYEHSAKSGACLHAAGNEARIRRAPETCLDHMFFALLQDGTDTSRFLDERGVNRNQWRIEVDVELPHFADGPRWPPNAFDLGMNIPESHVWTLKKDIPPDFDVSKLTVEERNDLIDLTPKAVRFTDLVWLRPSAKESKTIGYRLLHEAGITEDAIRAEIQVIETGNPEWYLVPPDLIQGIRNPLPRSQGIAHEQGKAIDGAALFVARLRWAPEIVGDHYLLALLISGTDTAKLLEDRGLAVADLHDELDRILPRYDSGPYFPQRAEKCLMASVTMLIGATDLSSDLKVIERLLTQKVLEKDFKPSLGVELLARNGIDVEVVADRLTELGLRLSPFSNLRKAE